MIASPVTALFTGINVYFDKIESFGEHDDAAGVNLPDETPKVGNGPLVRSLSHHVGIWFEDTLHAGAKAVNHHTRPDV